MVESVFVRRLALLGATLACFATTATLARQTAGPTPGPPASTDEHTAPASAGPLPSPTPDIDCRLRPLTSDERDTLLNLAWRTLMGHLTQTPIKDADLEAYTLTPCLMAPRGLFVTVKKGTQVRGRQGEIEATRPLYQQVIVFTRRAATRDPRFAPLIASDLDSLTLELSIIGERRKIDRPADFHPEHEGIFLEKWGRRALFLPGFAAQQGWTTERTLDELCSQAALPKGSWSESARLEVFTAEDVAGGAPPSPTPEPTPAPASTLQTTEP